MVTYAMVDEHFSLEPAFKEHPPIRLFAGFQLVAAERNARGTLMKAALMSRLLAPQKICL